ncbi:MAG: membrane protein insertase YidC [Alphaproteobacteria bacterium]|nr:membrane protein insertase YidC [Alphaproteobacteria bacterium]
MSDNRNMILFVALTAMVLIGWEYMFGKSFQPQDPTVQAVSTQSSVPTPAASAPGVTPAAPAIAAIAPNPELLRSKALSEAPRLRISTPKLHGSVSLAGGRLDDITLAKFREALDPTSPEIVMFSPAGSAAPYYAEFGWVAAGEARPKLPGPDSLWTTATPTLEPGKPVTLSWSNGEGLTFLRTIEVDEEYMFTITDQVKNDGASAYSLAPYGLVSRTDKPKLENLYILHEGPIGVFGGASKEVKYEDLDERGEIVEKNVTGGWVGITDKYWLAAVAPDPKSEVDARFLHRRLDQHDKYQTDFLGRVQALAPGASIQFKSYLFAGAKHVLLLDVYSEKLGIQRLDLAIDFGWFYFLTKPFFYILQWLHGLLGNFGLAILAMTVFLRGLMFPLANKSYKAMSKMKALQPQMKELQTKFADDKNRLNQEMMALYKNEKVNPMAGCLPILVQIPIFFALYKVLYVTIEMRHAPFYGWIHDLSAPDPTNLFTLFGLLPWNPPAFLMLGIWPIIMGVTMFLQQKLNPQPADPVQARMFMILPFVFTFMLATFPAGLVIYWAWSNVLSIIQQWVIMKRMGVKVG